MILSGTYIRECIEAGTIRIDPYNPEHINPASYDLTLGDEVAMYEVPGRPPAYSAAYGTIDVKDPIPVIRTGILSEGFLILPGYGYLMHTRERICTEHYVPIIDGKSSLGRLFVSIHQTAGYGDPGFDGQYTLEVTTIYPVRLYAGMRIAQIRFHVLHGKPELYAGKYTGESAEGPVQSQLWKQFKRSDE